MYLGNYLNVNEVETNTSIDAGSNYMYTNTNADYMPKKTATKFYPCGSIISDYHPTDGTGTTFMEVEGRNSIIMPRKTATQYFAIDYTNSAEYSKYAFNWNQPTLTWNDLAPNSWQGITTDTSYVDVSNCEVVEWRNLIEFDSNTMLHLHID